MGREESNVIPSKTDPIPKEIADIFSLRNDKATIATRAPKIVGINNISGIVNFLSYFFR